MHEGVINPLFHREALSVHGVGSRSVLTEPGDDPSATERSGNERLARAIGPPANLDDLSSVVGPTSNRASA